MLSCIIVGGGPGGLGPLIWAAQHGLLSDWLGRGVVLLERQRHLGGTLGRFGIPSDSLGGSYTEWLDAPRLAEEMLPLRSDAVVAEMAPYRDRLPPLVLVDRLMRRFGAAVASAIDASSASFLHLETIAVGAQLCADGVVAVDVIGRDGGLATLRAHSAVIAMGGAQDQPLAAWFSALYPEGCSTGSMDHVATSDHVLSRRGLRAVDDILAEARGRPIVILGGSHSAYVVASALLELPASDRLAPGQVMILQRRAPRAFYVDRAAALADFFDFAPDDICPRTQRVNRLSGLRGDGRAVWRRITGRPGTLAEPRVTVVPIQHFSDPELRALLERAALIVPCLGYRSVVLPVYDAQGRRLALNAEAGGVAVGSDSRLLLRDGATIPNLFGIGLGTGFRIPPGMGGEPSFDGQANSLWLYQNDIGEIVFRSIEALGAVAASGGTTSDPLANEIRF